MFRIEAIDRQEGRTLLKIGGDSVNGLTFFGIQDGHLEMYMGTYGLPAGVALTMLLGDALIEGIDMPAMDDVDASKKILAQHVRAASQFVWDIDKDEALAKITLADDTAEMVKNTWAIARQDALSSTPMSREDAILQRQASSDSIAQGHQRRQEELLAEEFMQEKVANSNNEEVQSDMWER